MPARRKPAGRKVKETGAAELRRRVADLTSRLEEAEATLSAIRGGEVDALVVSTSTGDAVFTLKGAEHAYRVFLEDMGDGAVTLTREGLILYANRRFAEIVGVPLERVIGNGIFRFVSPSDGDALKHLLANAASGLIHPEVSLKTTGGTVPVLLSVKALPETDPPALCMVVTDLTERVMAHKELLKAHREVAESERRFRSLVDNSLVGFFIVTGGCIVFANSEQRRIFGRMRIPAPVKDLKNVFPEDRTRFELLCDESSTTESGKMETDIRLCPETDTPGSGSMLWAHCSAAPIVYGGEKAVLINMVDVTRTREMEQVAVLQEKLASLGQIAAGIAHNIRNPLSGMNIYLSRMKTLIDDASGLDAQTREATHNIIDLLKQASGKISSVVRQVLDFVKPSQMEKTMVRVDGAIRDAMELCLITLRKNNISFDVAVPEGLPHCYSGAGLLEQVFINVINNAARALEDKPDNRRIEIRSEYSNGFIVVSIADSGPGVPGHLREKIFDPFYTTYPQGTGIGLAFSRRVLESIGGRIEAGDSVLGGAEFRIRIPAADRGENPGSR